MEAKKFKKPEFISEKQFLEHIKLYEGYIKKINEIGEKIKSCNFEDNNASFSETRSLKRGETFVTCAIKLHELYFANIGNEKYAGKIAKEIEAKWGFDKFKKSFLSSALSVRGWVILAWDNDLEKLKIYATDSHDNAVWNAIPLLVLDVYEHAYFLDYGTDRKKYIEDFFNNINWGVVNSRIKDNYD